VAQVRPERGNRSAAPFRPRASPGNKDNLATGQNQFGETLMNRSCLSIPGIVFAGVICGAFNAPELPAGEPLNLVKGATDRALQLLKNPQLQSKEKKAQRIERLKQIINPIFDYEETAKRALGVHWRRRTPAEQREFVKLFRAFLEKIYADRVDEYAGERIIFGREVIEDEYAEVYATVVNAKGQESPIIFKLRRVGDNWLVYDAVVENISIVNNYRSQFDRVIKSSSYEELVKKIREKIVL
jgi:phospholipid transport system substrate-binding protein